jgi:hypothetical protein
LGGCVQLWLSQVVAGSCKITVLDFGQLLVHTESQIQGADELIRR